MCWRVVRGAFQHGGGGHSMGDGGGAASRAPCPMADNLSESPQDEDLLFEIMLLGDLMIAANEEADGRVPPNVVDSILRDTRERTSTPWVPSQPMAGAWEDRDAGQRTRALQREIAMHRRAVEVHASAVARFTELGQLERAEGARMRLERARKLLHQALAATSD